MENPTGNNNQPNPPKPNIIFITVDQMRFPMNLPPKDPKNPSGTKLTPDEFIGLYMPNLWSFLWKDGVKFSNYYTAASDCTASRATIHTGLYAYQTYSMLTLITYPPDEPQQPILDPLFPTIGRLMRDEAHYETPYFGKWHLSYDVADLKDYGYTSHTPNQDYPGYAGEGNGTDSAVAWEAADWVTKHVAKSGSKPFFLTLNFVNPHDKQFFWGGMQANNFYEVFRNIPLQPAGFVPPGPYIEIPAEDNPSSVYMTDDINVAIPNFEDQTKLSAKPATQTLVKEVFQYQMGGIYETDEYEQGLIQKAYAPQGFFYGPAPAHQPYYKAVAPQPYWVKALDSYVQIMGLVDKAIGLFMNNIPESVRQNAVFIFTSDHGEYGSSHGLQGKGGTVYEEGIRVPLIVRDLTNGFAQQTTVTRKQLVSSVDLLPMIVTMGYGGTGWRTGNSDYQQLYGNRLNLLGIVGSNNVGGRTFALHSTDEFVPDVYNFNDSHLHVIGQITCDPNGDNKKKLGVYTTWESDSPEHATVKRPTPANVEFYDLNTQPNEKVSSDYDSPPVQTALGQLFGTGSEIGRLYSELQAPLPNEVLQAAQTSAYDALRAYEELLNKMTSPDQPSAAEEVERRLARVWAF